MFKKILIVFIVFMVICSGSITYSAITATSLRESMMNNPNVKTNKGESFCWHAAYGISRFQWGYEAFKDSSWLDEAIKYYDWLISKMDTAPDGYKGWIGPYMYDEKVLSDCHVGDAILIGPMLRFAETVLKDPVLKSKYEKKANEYVELAKKHLIEKWDKRNSWFEDGSFGFYAVQQMFIDPSKPNEWIYQKEKQKSLPYNKQEYMGRCILRLYRITGEQFYKDRAIKLFSLIKSRFRFFDNMYVLNYWEPFALFDIDMENARPVHWVNVHPNPGYAASEVEGIVECYHTGLVFSEEDIKRLVNTNLWMWNKSMKDIHFKSSGGYEKNKEGRDAGVLWSSLVDFDSTLRQIYELQLKNDEIGMAYFKNVIIKRPVSFKRRYVKDTVELSDIPITKSKDITFAAAIPTIIDTGRQERMVLICKVHGTGELKVKLISEDGKFFLDLLTEDIKDFDTDGLKSFYLKVFDGKDSSGKTVPSGNYKVQWTLKNDLREVSIAIK